MRSVDPPIDGLFAYQFPVDKPGRKASLAVLESRVKEGDPIALYQAVILCNMMRISPPRWLTASLLQAIAGYHLGKKPGKKGGGNNPLAKIGKRLEIEIRIRAVQAVRLWQKDHTRYNEMPRQSIQAWFDGVFDHDTHQTVEHALQIAQIGLTGLRVREGGTLIKCSPITLKRTYYSKKLPSVPAIPPEAAMAFGFHNPDDFFGTDQPLPDHLK